MNANEKDFDEKLKILGGFYEEGKDCLNRMFIPPGHEWEKDYLRLFVILQGMRDIAATQMRAIHDVPQN